jgi:putative spermidine/putrescine transport system substrate-binding protein
VPVATACRRLDRALGLVDAARGARHPDCMYRWLDYILSAKANAASARYLHEAPATPAPART